MRVVAGLVVVLLPGVLLAPVWRLAGLGAGEDDILYFYPSRAFLHQTVRAGEWPWLNPWTGLGRPFAADPQAAVWYPATWLFAALPPLWAYPASLWAHYSLALWGMYRLLRALALNRQAALFGGIAFAFCGFMLAHRAHLNMQHAAAWTPWVLWRLYRYAIHPTPVGRTHDAHGVRRLAATSAVLALQCLAGHIQVAAITAVGSLVFLLAHGPHTAEPGSRRLDPCAGAGFPSRTRRVAAFVLDRRQALLRWLIVWVCAGGLFAIQWLPTLDYLRLCTRTGRTYEDFVENSWHPVSAIGGLLPMVFGQRTPNFFDQPYWGPSHQVEQFAYAGLVPLLLAALALRTGWRADPRRRRWVILALFGLLLALGEYGPLCPILYWLPGSTLFRCPARAMLLVNFALAALAAVTFHDLAARLSPQRVRLRAVARRWTQRPLLLGGLLVAIPWALILTALPLLNVETRAAAWRAVQPVSPAVWLPLVIALAAVISLGIVVRRWRQPRVLWLLTALTAIDLGVVGWTIDVPAGRGSAEELLTPRQAAGWMQSVRQSPHRLWVVTDRRGRTPGEYLDPVEKAVANTNMLRQIAALTDYGPLQPQAFVHRFGFEPWGEALQADALLAESGWMRLCNVGWILLCDEHRPAPTGCDLVTTTSAGWRLFGNPSAPGWACFENADQPGAVTYQRQSQSKFTIRVDSWPTESAPSRKEPASTDRAHWPRVVVSQLALPGWTAWIDGHPTRIETVGGLLMGVRVPPGEAVEIMWSYFPPGLRSGAVITLVCAAVLAGATWWSSRRRRSPARAEN